MEVIIEDGLLAEIKIWEREALSCLEIVSFISNKLEEKQIPASKINFSYKKFQRRLSQLLVDIPTYDIKASKWIISKEK
jgi:hypothetical protein